MKIDLEDIFAGPRYPKGTAHELSDRNYRIFRTAESPIEKVLGLQLVLSDRFVMLPAEHVEHELHHSEVALIPQYRVGRYRLDMFMRFRGYDGEIHQIGLECDGKQYHRTEEAKRRDQTRDRELNRLGIQVWRYPGWFLHHHPHVAADEIEDAIHEVKRGQEPTLTFSHNRESETPTLREFEAAYYAFSRGVPWPPRMGESPRARGWECIEDAIIWFNAKRSAA